MKSSSAKSKGTSSQENEQAPPSSLQRPMSNEVIIVREESHQYEKRVNLEHEIKVGIT